MSLRYEYMIASDKENSFILEEFLSASLVIVLTWLF